MSGCRETCPEGRGGSRGTGEGREGARAGRRGRAACPKFRGRAAGLPPPGGGQGAGAGPGLAGLLWRRRGRHLEPACWRRRERGPGSSGSEPVRVRGSGLRCRCGGADPEGSGPAVESPTPRSLRSVSHGPEGSSRLRGRAPGWEACGTDGPVSWGPALGPRAREGLRNRRAAKGAWQPGTLPAPFSVLSDSCE